MSLFILTSEETRVLGVLVEKQLTTPEYYPLTANALRNACNQKSNRFPVVNYDDETVQEAIDGLRKKQLLLVVTSSGSRVRKYEHRLKETLFLTLKEISVLCVLMLRGPQTVGELRSRTERMCDFEDLADVEQTLSDLAADGRNPAPLTVKLPVLSGQKEHRYMHCLAGEPDLDTLVIDQPRSAGSDVEHSETQERLDTLEAEVRRLSEALDTLRQGFEAFKKQFE